LFLIRAEIYLLVYAEYLCSIWASCYQLDSQFMIIKKMTKIVKMTVLLLIRI